ncbi:hypothetical protein GTU79_05415 [Sodalis ligni]|uniref:hypothetical protein n=1 Tax=Sodalis ligni TaxID=2697027 RepID=UPI00193FF69A|nr:hypothetical protein [Sodalis ligni]QWA12200.1 hypothetical protein GTU79_05415 [Sodalis ligni]
MAFDIQPSPVNTKGIPSDYPEKNSFCDRWPTEDRRLLDELKERATRNDTASIEYLFTLACEASERGAEAEDCLFDLYRGKGPDDTRLREQIGKDSLRLFTLVQQRNQNTRRESTDIWELPASLLLMAAFEAQSGSEQQAELFGKLQNTSIFLHYVSELEENTAESALATNRFISSAEIDVFANALEVDSTLTFYPAANVSQSEVTDGNHRRVLLSLESPDADSRRMSFGGAYNASDGISASEPAAGFIPLLFRDHWILFGWFINADEQKEAIVLDSSHYLNNDEKNYLVDLAHRCGVGQQQEVTFIDDNLQENAPNACGLFVAKAMESLAGDSLSRVGKAYPKETLRSFAGQFSATHLDSVEEQRLFNRHGRAELYAIMARSLNESLN